MSRYLTIKKFSAETGYSENAVRNKIQRGEWLEGALWKSAPDGRVLMDMEGFQKWVERKIPPVPFKQGAASP